METRYVGDTHFHGDDWIFVCDSQDVDALRMHGYDREMEYDIYFVKISDGYYWEIWGMYGTIPYDTKILYRIL